MVLIYNKLWKLLIDRGINKTDLCSLTKISQSTMAKLSKGKNVNTDILDRICRSLKCNIDEIVEYIEMEIEE